MAMEVLLRRNIEGVGNVGEVVRVKNGYARNFLIPKGYAALVTADAKARIHKDSEREAKRQAELHEYNQELAKQLADMTLTIEVRAGEDGHLYGSVTTRQVLAAFEERGYRFQERQIRFEPVRELGEYQVPVHLSAEVQETVSLWVVQDVRDIEAMKAAAIEAAEAAAAAEAAGELEGDNAGEAAPAEATADETESAEAS